jgi:glycosyltransferase involved in cell wall biosynthesis
MSDMSVAMIYRGDAPHPAHRGFAEAIDADLLSLNHYSLDKLGLSNSIPEELLNGFLAPDYDVHIAEGTRALYGALTKQVSHESTLIYLAGDQALHKLLDPSYEHESTLNHLIAEYGMGLLSHSFNKYIDGVIAVSEFSLKYTMEVLDDKPSHVANPYIQPDLFDRLGDVDPNLDAKTAITVGSHAKYKGQDILVDAWPAVRDEHPRAELHLVGRGYPPLYEDIPGIKIRGYVENLPDVLGSMSLYIQPSRVDNFPVSVLEALRAGLPALVTETTGNKKIIEKIDDDLIVEPDSERLAAGVSRYFNHTNSKKDKLSTQARSKGHTFDSDSRKAAFKTAFNEVLTEIQQRN